MQGRTRVSRVVAIGLVLGAAGVIRAVAGDLELETAERTAESHGRASMAPGGAGRLLGGGPAQLSPSAEPPGGSGVDVTTDSERSGDRPRVALDAGAAEPDEVGSGTPEVVESSTGNDGVTRRPSKRVLVVPRAPGVGSHAGRFAVWEGTQTCLGCHPNEGLEAHASVHYQWRGDASRALGLIGPEAGKLGGINDFCIYPDINWIGQMTNLDGVTVDGGCAQCHAGLGLEPTADPTPEQLENVDCLVCHSAPYRRKVARVGDGFRFVPDEERMGMTVLEAAWQVERPGSDSCLDCHARAGGGDNFKRGDIEEAHRAATAAFDVHMAASEAGGAGLDCLDCHTAAGHRIAGRGSDLRPLDSADPVRCTSCHRSLPHGDDQLDRHTARIDCTTCHIPQFAKVAATDMRRDWSAPGDLDPGRRLYEPHHTKGTNVVPEYRFWNGTSWFYQFGDPAVPGANGRIVMSEPVGTIAGSGARIFPFKRHTALQPIDPATRRLLPLRIGIFFQSGDIDAAVEQGTLAVGWPYAGHEFAETERWMGIFHEVAPKEQALSCASCHPSTGRLDFAALGYAPLETRNGKPLCSSCHGRKNPKPFYDLHDKHVRAKRIDCSSCHAFSAAS